MFNLLEPCTSCGKCCTCMYTDKENRAKRYEEAQQNNTEFVDCFENKSSTTVNRE